MLDPTDYDPDELQALTDGAVASSPEGGASARWASPTEFLGAVDSRVQASQLGELYFLAAAMDGAKRPYLRRLPNVATGARLALDWLEFLVEIGGHEGATEALSYYRSIQWLGEPAYEELTALIDGLQPSDAGSLGPGHHRTSLVFVARLAALR